MCKIGVAPGDSMQGVRSRSPVGSWRMLAPGVSRCASRGRRAAMPAAHAPGQVQAVATPHRQTRARKGGGGLHWPAAWPRVLSSWRVRRACCARGAAQQESNSHATWESQSAGGCRGAALIALAGKRHAGGLRRTPDLPKGATTPRSAKRVSWPPTQIGESGERASTPGGRVPARFQTFVLTALRRRRVMPQVVFKSTVKLSDSVKGGGEDVNVAKMLAGSQGE